MAGSDQLKAIPGPDGEMRQGGRRGAAALPGDRSKIALDEIDVSLGGKTDGRTWALSMTY